MKIKIYNSSKEFLIDHLDLLLKEEAVNQLLINNAKNLEGKILDKDTFLGELQNDKGETLLLFSRNQGYNLLISGPEHYLNECVYLAKFLYANSYSIDGVNAASPLAKAFIDQYGKEANLPFRIKLSMDIMVLTHLIKVPLAKGKVYQPSQSDLDKAMVFLYQFYEDTYIGTDQLNLAEQQKKMSDRIRDGKLYFFSDESNKVVAMCAVTRQLVNGVSISLVYTDRDERGKGYATTLMYEVAKKMFNLGNHFCTLFVDKTNPISNRVYENIGYKIVADNYDYTLIK